MFNYIRNLYWKRLTRKQRWAINAYYEKYFPQSLKIPFSRILGSNYFQTIFNENKVIFFHVPKAAGTSIATSIYSKHTVGHLKAETFKALNPASFNNNYKFSVVREPFDRFVSSYNFYVNGGGSTVKVKGDDWWKKTYGRDIYEFAQNMLNISDLSIIDPVFDHQTNYIFDENDNLLVDFVGKLEELNEVEVFLSKALSREIIFSRLNSVQKNQKLLKDIDLISLKTLIKKIYSRDYELLGYE